MPTFLFPSLLVLGLFPLALAVRIVVDDANSSWTYSSPWNAVSPSNPCSSCLINPEPSKALNQTWHDTAYVNTAQLSFTGVSIEIYTICPLALSSGDFYGTNLTFTLDSISTSRLGNRNVGIADRGPLWEQLEYKAHRKPWDDLCIFNLDSDRFPSNGQRILTLEGLRSLFIASKD